MTAHHKMSPKEEAELNWLDAELRVYDAQTALKEAQSNLANRLRQLDEAYKIYSQACLLARESA